MEALVYQDALYALGFKEILLTFKRGPFSGQVKETERVTPEEYVDALLAAFNTLTEKYKIGAVYDSATQGDELYEKYHFFSMLYDGKCWLLGLFMTDNDKLEIKFTPGLEPKEYQLVHTIDFPKNVEELRNLYTYIIMYTKKRLRIA